MIPVKRFGEAKSRLALALEPDGRRALAAAMAADSIAAVAGAERIERIVCVSGEPGLEPIALETGAELIDDPHDLGHSEAAAIGIEALAAGGVACAAVLSADCPLLEPEGIDRALAGLGARSVGVIPDRHGSGTNGLLLAPPEGIAPSFGPGSHARHLEAAHEAGLEGRSVRIESMLLDLDTPEDLELLRAELRADPSRAPRTAAWLGDSR